MIFYRVNVNNIAFGKQNQFLAWKLFICSFLFQAYTPTSFDKSFGSQEVNKHTVHFNFWDTSGEWEDNLLKMEKCSSSVIYCWIFTIHLGIVIWCNLAIFFAETWVTYIFRIILLLLIHKNEYPHDNAKYFSFVQRDRAFTKEIFRTTKRQSELLKLKIYHISMYMPLFLLCFWVQCKSLCSCTCNIPGQVEIEGYKVKIIYFHVNRLKNIIVRVQ